MSAEPSARWCRKFHINGIPRDRRISNIKIWSGMRLLCNVELQQHSIFWNTATLPHKMTPSMQRRSRSALNCGPSLKNKGKLQNKMSGTCYHVLGNNHSTVPRAEILGGRATVQNLTRGIVVWGTVQAHENGTRTLRDEQNSRKTVYITNNTN